MSKLQQYTFVCAPSALQWAAAAALDVNMSEHIQTYRKRRDLVVEMLGDVTELAEFPGGAFVHAFPRRAATDRRRVREQVHRKMPGKERSGDSWKCILPARHPLPAVLCGRTKRISCARARGALGRTARRLIYRERIRNGCGLRWPGEWPQLLARSAARRPRWPRRGGRVQYDPPQNSLFASRTLIRSMARANRQSRHHTRTGGHQSFMCDPFFMRSSRIRGRRGMAMRILSRKRNILDP